LVSYFERTFIIGALSNTTDSAMQKLPGNSEVERKQDVAETFGQADCSEREKGWLLALTSQP